MTSPGSPITLLTTFAIAYDLSGVYLYDISRQPYHSLDHVPGRVLRKHHDDDVAMSGRMECEERCRVSVPAAEAGIEELVGDEELPVNEGRKHAGAINPEVLDAGMDRQEDRERDRGGEQEFTNHLGKGDTLMRHVTCNSVTPICTLQCFGRHFAP